MQVHYTSSIDLTDAIKNHTQDKLEKLEQRDADIEKVFVNFRVEKGIHIAEGNLRLNNADLHATAKADNLYTAIDEMADKLLVQVTRQKEKITNHHHHGEH